MKRVLITCLVLVLVCVGCYKVFEPALAILYTELDAIQSKSPGSSHQKMSDIVLGTDATDIKLISYDVNEKAYLSEYVPAKYLAYDPDEVRGIIRIYRSFENAYFSALGGATIPMKLEVIRVEIVDRETKGTMAKNTFKATMPNSLRLSENRNPDDYVYEYVYEPTVEKWVQEKWDAYCTKLPGASTP